MAHKCDTCEHCNVLKKKLAVYEKCFQELKEIDDQHSGQFQDLEESIIIFKDTEGNLNKKIHSDLGESILVIEKGKNLSELNKKEQDAIKEQDNYRAYEQTKKATEKINSTYSVISYVLGLGKIILLF